MNLEDWMKIEDMSIYGVNTSDLVYYQPGQELHPEGASLEVFREKAGEAHMQHTWDDLRTENPDLPSYEEAKDAVGKLADTGVKAVGEFAQDVQSGEFANKVAEAGKNAFETVKTGFKTMFMVGGSKKLQSQAEGLSEEEAKAKEAYEQNKTEQMPSYEEAKENVGKVLNKGVEAVASGKVFEEGKKVLDDLVDKVKTGAETLWNGLTGQKPATEKTAEERGAQKRDERVKQAENILGRMDDGIQSQDYENDADIVK
jgi:hypothetical protein